MTLRQNQREYFYDQLENGSREKTWLGGIRRNMAPAMFAGQENAKILGEAFRRACRKEGILYSMTEIIKAYRAPYDPVQTSLF